MKDKSGRQPTEEEQAILGHLLSVDFPGARELRAQVGHTVVVSHWGSSSPSLDCECQTPLLERGSAMGRSP
jgi:hypothetical protein